MYKGSLFAGGPFQNVEGRYTQHLARWDGTAWQPVGAVSSSYYCCYELNTMTVYQDELVVGGNFGDPRDTPTRGVARWDGSTWRPFGAGVNGHVRAMLPIGDSLFVAGEFDSAGSAPAANIACWTDDAWSPVGAGVVGTVRALAEFRGQVIAGGYIQSAGGQAIHTIAAWDGSAWSSLAGYEAFTVSALTVHQDTLIVASYPDILRWDGTAWAAPLYGIRGEPEALLSDGDDIIAAGDVVVLGSGGFEIARWNGESWSAYEAWNAQMKGLAMFAGHQASVYSLASFRGNLVAGGLIEYAGTGTGWQAINEICSWDGTNWDRLPLSNGSDLPIPTAMMADGDTLFAAGSFYRFSLPGFVFSPAMRWDAGQWTYLDTLSTTGTCLARYNGQLVLGTWRNSSNDGPSPGVYVWDGAKWRAIGLTSGSNEFHGVRSVAVREGVLIAGGPFTAIDGVPANGIAYWDGQSWRSFGPGPNYGYEPWVVDFGTYHSSLIAAGEFTEQGRSVPLVSLDGEVWKPIAGITGSALAMKVIGGKVFVSGWLYIDPNPERVNVAVWDGRKWDSLGSGMNEPASAILEHDGSLYFGGYCSMAGGKSSFGIARWDGLSQAPTAKVLSLSQGRPNPFPSLSSFSLSLEREGRIRIAVYDALGREVRILQDDILPAGPHAMGWDGKDASGKAVPAGVYFISAQDQQGASASRKIVRLK